MYMCVCVYIVIFVRMYFRICKYIYWVLLACNNLSKRGLMK